MTQSPTIVDMSTLKGDAEVRMLLQRADENMAALGYTEHGFRHAAAVSANAFRIMSELGRDERSIHLASVSGYLHDIGNAVNRNMHAETGAILAYNLLRRLGMSLEDASVVLGAVGNHEETTGHTVSEVSAAVILADKADVHRSRVRAQPSDYDIHDRVNHAAVRTVVKVNRDHQAISLEIEIEDEPGAGVLDYFEIFLNRMLVCRHAATFLGCRFELVINGHHMF